MKTKEKITFIKTSEKVSVDNYPYGWLRTTAFFSIEFKSGRGFRKVFQTINPKTGILNKPKKSTYSPIKVLVKAEDGKIKSNSLDFYGSEGMERAFSFLNNNFDLFSEEQIKSLAVTSLSFIKADIVSHVTYCNSKLEDLKPLYDNAIKTLVKIANDGENLFNEVTIDFEAVEATKEEGYQPFKITSN